MQRKKSACSVHFGSRGARRKKQVEDPDTGALAPGAGASRDFAPHKGRSPFADGASGRTAENRSGSGQVADASLHGKPRSKKRRKRRRGRKVFARDTVPPAAAAQPDAAPSAGIVLPVQDASQPAPAAEEANPPPRRVPQPDLPVFAALDLGTNNCR